MTTTAEPAPNSKVHVIFPCYDEEEGLEKLLLRFIRVAKVSSRPFSFVVVDDGSTDHSAIVARSFGDEMPITVISFDENRGVADVFNTAFAHVLESADDNDIVITIDSDNTMNPFVVLDMLDTIRNADVVIASRFAPGGKMIGAGYRALLSHIASWLMCWRIAIPHVTDYSIFYRCCRVGLLRAVFEKFKGKPVDGAGFSCMANLLIRMHDLRAGLRFAEVPLVLRYDLKAGGSGVKIFKTIRGYLKIAFGKDQKNG